MTTGRQEKSKLQQSMDRAMRIAKSGPRGATDGKDYFQYVWPKIKDSLQKEGKYPAQYITYMGAEVVRLVFNVQLPKGVPIGNSQDEIETRSRAVRAALGIAGNRAGTGGARTDWIAEIDKEDSVDRLLTAQQKVVARIAVLLADSI